MNTLLLFVIFPLLLGLYAQYRIHAAYHRNARIASRGRITGSEAAEAILRASGIFDVSIVKVPGELTDHYDPLNKRLALSEANYDSTSLAALGVAAHEAGHAIQHKTSYALLNARQLLAPTTTLCAGMANLLIIGGIVLGSTLLGGKLLMAGAVALGVIVFFNLITLPVEFDASNRAKTQLVALGILDKDELLGVNETLNAAALTYVAAFVSALGSLLHLLTILNHKE
jgi:uncharacterized protein